MLPADLIRRGEHALTVCNACRYCEAYCPVFPAIEQRVAFQPADLTYLANLCHNCGECLYACQYAPPHEFGLNLPRLFAELRLASYEEYCWPRPLAMAFKRHAVITPLVVACAILALLLTSHRPLWTSGLGGNFYGVLPHATMVFLFGGVSLLVLASIVIGFVRFWRHLDISTDSLGGSPSALLAAIRDAVTLRHLHSDGVECTSSEETRSPWRRRFHHFTMYGFGLCFASTCVGAVYHSWFGWVAPYPYTSLPVVLGTVGGLGLLLGPAGLFVLRRRHDPMLHDSAQGSLDVSFILLLFGTSLTGLLLMVWRDHAAMGILLNVHLAFVLALFITMPYGKFIHGIYRTAALVKYSVEKFQDETDRRIVGLARPGQPDPVELFPVGAVLRQPPSVGK